MYYKKNPESHPGYSSEWKIFWERRYQELAAKGLDPNKHDFKSEWAMFWNDRMKDIFSAAVENKKEALLTKHKICKVDLEEKRPVSPWEDSESRNVCKNDFSVIGTLQALTEVETLLGAFGPAINTLLRKALSYQAERKNPWDIFSDSDSVTLIKLSVDKLSGSVSCGGNSSSVCRKNAVECAKWLLDQVGLRKEEENFLGLNMKELAEKTLGMDTVQIAQQIALSLLKIGKSNASEDDLQKILLAVSASHAKLLLEKQSKQPSSSVPSQNTTHQTSVGKPLFPSAAFSFEAKASTSVNDSEVKPTNEKKSPSSNDACTSSGALGQLISAYDDEEPVRDMEKLSLDDLVNLLSNFKDLSGDEQQALTAYLKRLEATDTKKVTKLRELVQKKRETQAVVRKTADSSGIKNKSKTTDSSDGSCSADRNYAPERVTNPEVRSYEKESTSPHESTKSGESNDHKNLTELRGGKYSTQTASSISDERSPARMQNENKTISSEPNGDALHQVSYSSVSYPPSVHGSPASVRLSRERSVSRAGDSQGQNNELNYHEDRQPFLRSSSVHRYDSSLDSRGDSASRTVGGIPLQKRNSSIPPRNGSPLRFQDHPEAGDRRDSHPMHPRDGHSMQSVADRPAHSEVNNEIYQRENSSIARANQLFHPHESIRDVRPIYPGDDPSAYPLDLPMHPRIDTALHYRDGRPVQRDGLPLQPRDDSPMHQRIGFPIHRRSISPMHSRGGPAVYPREGPPVYQRNSPPEHLRDGPLAHPRANPLGYPVDDAQMQLRGAPPLHHRHKMPGEDSRMYPHDDFPTRSDMTAHGWNDRENFRDEAPIRPLMELDTRCRSSVNPWEGSHITEERPFVDRIDSVPQHLKMDTMPARNEPFFPRGGRPVDDFQLRNFPQDSFDNPRSEQSLRSHSEMMSSNPRILPSPIGPLDPAISSDSRMFDETGRSGSAEIFSRETSDHMRGGFARDAVHPTISRQLSRDFQGSRNPYEVNDSNRLHSNVFEHDVSRPYPKPRDEPQSDHPFDKFVMNREAESHGVRPFSRNQRGGFPPSQHDRTSGQFPYRR